MNRYIIRKSVAAALVLALVLTFSCSSDTETLLELDSSSSAKLPEGYVYCIVGNVCEPVSETNCYILQGTVVPSCEIGSSSSSRGTNSSSSRGNSSSSSITQSSSSSSSRGNNSSSSIGNYITVSNFTLSYDGTSYGDIDAAKTYRQGELTTVKERIDVVAYYTYDALRDYILNPCYVTTIGSDGCGGPKFYPIPAKYHSNLKNAMYDSDIEVFTKALSNGEITGSNNENEVYEIPIVPGDVFLVRSTSFEYYVVIITNVYARSVTLQFYNIFAH
jgi:hypothetical protein